MKQGKLKEAKRAKTWLVKAEQEKQTASMFPVASADKEFLEKI